MSFEEARGFENNTHVLGFQRFLSLAVASMGFATVWSTGLIKVQIDYRVLVSFESCLGKYHFERLNTYSIKALSIEETHIALYSMDT